MAHLPTPKSSPNARNGLLPCGCSADCRCPHTSSHKKSNSLTSSYGYPSPASDSSRSLPSHHSPVFPDNFLPPTPNSSSRSLPPKSPSQKHASPEIFLHPLLAYQPNGRPTIQYNLIHAPTNIQHSGAQSRSGEFLLPATSPPTRRLRLVSEHLPWAIDITNPPNAPVISVIQVLDAIYSALRVGVTTTEWRIASPQLKTQVAEAHRRRRETSKDPKREAEAGVRRIDWLVRRVMFKGLRKDEGEIITILNGRDEHLPYTLILELGM